MMRAATYNRISKRELSRDDSALVRQQWETGKVARPIDCDFLSFSDEQTGKRDDRPEFQKLLKLIETKQIDIVIVSKIDRITRDLETNARLAKLFERTGVQIYEILLGRTIDWKNPNDWSYFVSSGVKAEEEIRRSSQRIHLAFEWRREQGKPAGGGTPFGYRRSSEGFYELNPDTCDRAVALILKIIEMGGTAAMVAVYAREELGLSMTRTGIYEWIRSPTIRGYTVWQGIPSKEKTHASLFDLPDLAAIGAEARIDRIVSRSPAMRGLKKGYRNYPLQGLLYCGRCGGTCHIRKIKSSKYPDHEYFYICCGDRISSAIDCGGKYGAYMGRRGTINTPYDLADRAVLDAMRAQAIEVVKRTAEQAAAIAAIPQESLEVKKLRAEIARLEALDDPDLTEAIERKRARCRELTTASIPDHSMRYRWEELAVYSQISDFWEGMTDEQKRTLYQDFVERVECDRENVVVRLRI